MGEVYLAQDTRLGRKVAIKVLPAEFASDPERLARFEQEARAAAMTTKRRGRAATSIEEKEPSAPTAPSLERKRVATMIAKKTASKNGRRRAKRKGDQPSD